MGCSHKEIIEKNKNNKNIVFKPINKEKNNETNNQIQVPIATIGNDPKTQTQNIVNNYSQILTNQTNTLQNNNNVKNLIEDKKDNIEKIFKEKPKNLYCYNDEEYLEILELLNKNNFEKDSMIYYKLNYEIEDYQSTHLTEYIVNLTLNPYILFDQS